MGTFVADRLFLGEIGTLDKGMEVYGGENVELGIRVSFKCILIRWCYRLLHLVIVYCRFGFVVEASKSSRALKWLT